MTEKIKIISPHFDDGVFSAFNLINQNKTSLITVFSQIPNQNISTLWDRLCSGQSSSQLMKKRQIENQTALQSYQTKLINLNLLDRQYRRQNIKKDTILSELLKHISRQDQLFFPLALSRYFVHPDHQILASIGLKLLKQNYQISFYIDQPYMIPPIIFTSNYQKKMIHKIYQKYQVNCQIQIIKLDQVNRHKKNHAMHQYKSQYFFTNLVSFGRLSLINYLGHEVYIIPDKAL